jgi:hypothetical protein
MKSSFLRPAVALALALGLSACGGGKAMFTLGGNVGNLVYPGLVLVNELDSTELAVAAGATTFAFPQELEYGTEFDVKIKSQPQHQTCELARGHDTAGRMANITIFVQCSLNVFTLGGKVSGLTTDGLVLANGTTGGTVTVPKNAAAFTFPIPVPFGASYGVTVLTQPAGQTCTVSSGVGEMGDAKVENIQVDCTTSIGG